jgi:dihydroflavonol-4-reductase
MTVLVTGATGLLGNNVTRRLLSHGYQVRVLVREKADPRPLEGLEVEVRQGDLRDASVVKSACADIETVFHAAAMIHLGWSQLEPARQVNVVGTRNVCQAARDVGARLIHVSSVDTLGLGSPKEPADEDTPEQGKIPCTYVVTKREAEAVVRDYIAEGLDAVIVHPGFMLGPWDWKPSSGRMLLAVATSFTPLAPTGGLTICDVRDVADGILAAWRQAPSGRNYILAGQNMRYVDAWRLFADVTGGSRPWFRAGPLMRILGGRFGDLWGKVSGREPDVNSAAVAMSGQFHYYRSDRAQRELGYHCRPARESVEDAWQWFREQDYA